jgi:DNA-binding phage protein
LLTFAVFAPLWLNFGCFHKAPARRLGHSHAADQPPRRAQEKIVPLTKDLCKTVKARADRDPAFRVGLYREAVQALIEADFGTARILLRDFINATIGFSAVARRLGLVDKSVMRMFGPSGNPTVANLLAVMQVLQDECQLSVTVHEKQPPCRAVRETQAAALPAR